MLSNTEMLIYVLVIAAAVFSTRAMSFVLFPAGKQTPKIILFLGNTLPCALMALLVVYCLKSVSLLAYPHGIPEAVAIAVTALLHLWKKNTLLSMGVGTVIYMILVQGVF
ncbi:MAG: AzlD domain-containing protein [Firmicutes bacterium]|nr:AzlD domain-containing protein [Bacillota bacterium]MBQ6810122.1 AzlD domain-containing protein [Bacillota bacterium]